MQKYIEAVMRKSSGLQILAEIDHFEISSRVAKNTPRSIVIVLTKKTRNYINVSETGGQVIWSDLEPL